MSDFLHHKQLDAIDCGLSCLCIASKYYGKIKVCNICVGSRKTLIKLLCKRIICLKLFYFAVSCFLLFPLLISCDSQKNDVFVIDEYHYGLKFAMDDENRNIYLVDRNTIKVYQLNGRLIRSFSTKDFFNGAARDIKFFNSSLFLADYGEDGTFKYNWVITDTLGNRLSYKYSNVKTPGFLFRGNTYKIGDKLCYYNWLNDTIFSISPDFSFKPGYLFAQGNFRYPENIELNELVAGKKMKTFFRPLSMFETTHFVFLRYAFRDKNASILMIDKKNKETYQGYVENYGACIENDFDGGLHFMPDAYQFCYYIDEHDHEYIITLIYPFELKAHVDSETFKNSTPKHPEKKKELELLANNLEENDNPVLMLVKLK